MKKIIVSSIITIAVFGGCSTMDMSYNKAKTLYGVGKVVYKVNEIKSERIEAINESVIKYDTTRTIIRRK